MASAKASRRSTPPRHVKRGRILDVSDRTFYVESSALLAALLEHDAVAMRSLRSPGRRVTSALTFTEANRAVLRGRLSGRLTSDQERAALRALQTFERRSSVIMVSEYVLARAGHPFPAKPMRTLDAIHLATVEQLGGPPQLLTIVTRDARIRENAIALGYAVE